MMRALSEIPADTFDLRDVVEGMRSILDELREELDADNAPSLDVLLFSMESDRSDDADFLREMVRVVEVEYAYGIKGDEDSMEKFETACDQLESLANNEPTMVPESDFKSYAAQLAEELDMIPENATWPNNHIDWEAAANELKQDYSEVTIDGVTYLTRSQ